MRLQRVGCRGVPRLRPRPANAWTAASNPVGSRVVGRRPLCARPELRRGDRRPGPRVRPLTTDDDPEPQFAVFVHPEVQGAGLATELCRHAIASAADADRDALLDVARGNHRAIRLYRRLGFETVDSEESGVSAGDSTRMRLDLRREVATDVRLPLGVGDARLRYLFQFIIYL